MTDMIRYHHAGLHTPDDLYAGALAGALAAVDSGTTTVTATRTAPITPKSYCAPWSTRGCTWVEVQPE